MPKKTFTKLSQSLPFHLPTVQELLQNPLIRPMTERINPIEVAHTARNVLNELRLEMRTVTREGKLPSISELAERIAAQLKEREVHTEHPLVNATGILLHSEFGPPPLPLETSLEMARVFHGPYQSEHRTPAEKRQQSHREIQRRLRQLGRFDDAVVVQNTACARLLVFQAIARTGRTDILLSHNSLCRFPEEYPLRELLHSIRPTTFQSVGTVNHTTLDDYREKLAPESAMLYRLHPGYGPATKQSVQPGLKELAQLAQEAEIPFCIDLAPLSLIDLKNHNLSEIPCLRDFAELADLAIFEGGGLLGGPPCGIIAGKHSLIASLQKSPLASAFSPDLATLFGLDKTLQLYEKEEENVRFTIPILKLLTTSVENLKTRAERLLPQIAESKIIREASLEETSTTLGPPPFSATEIPTIRIRIRPANLNAGGMERRLKHTHPSVYPIREKEHIVLDLRSIPPVKDIELVDAFLSLQPFSPEDI
jgi:L-seryl-tRNA(Ser) seleniumtransferase